MNLLVAALHRAVALRQVHGIPERIAKDLVLHVAGLHDELLQQDLVVVERLHRFALARVERVQEVVFVLHQAHPFAPAPVPGLDQDGVLDFRGFFFQVQRVLVGTVVARSHLHVGIQQHSYLNAHVCSMEHIRGI